MSKERFTTQESPFIRVDSCQGDLIIRGWAESSLEIKGDFQTHHSDKGFLITGQGNLYLNVPEGAFLSVGKVGGELIVRHVTGISSYEYVQGDAAFTQTGDTKAGIVHGNLVAKQITGALSVDEVNGDVVVRGAGETTLVEVHGDLSARLVDGNITVETINGDTSLRNINGNVAIQRGYRDVNLIGVNGLVNIKAIMGDIRLRGGLSAGDHSLEARGDIIVRWPASLPVNLNITAAKINNRLSLEDITDKKGTQIGRIGQGDTYLTLVSEGQVVLRESEPDHGDDKQIEGNMEFGPGFEFDDIATRIEAEVNNHISRVTRDLETKFGKDFGQRISEKLARRSEKAAGRARRQAEFQRQPSGFDFGFTAPTAPIPGKIVSTEEQLKILKMVEDGKISPKEAEMLMEALES